MSVLRVIRHGQASYFADDYDNLSSLGEEQARALGRYWIEQDQKIDRVVVGPRRRHRQTLEAVAAIFRDAGRDWPEVQEVDELDEHSGQEVVHQALPGWIEQESVARPEFARLAERKPEDLRLFFQAFRDITRRWARGELATPAGLESWADFRARVHRGLRRILDGMPHRDQTVAVFTSGGPVATSTGLALDLPDEKVIELSWRVRNAAYADLVVNDEGLSVDCFNAWPHLGESRLVTHI